MIIWINGAFGSGKTQTAFELQRRLPNSYVYDPENAGYFIRKNIPEELKIGDFQDYTMWREFNFLMLKYIANKYKGIIIVPMTLVNSAYFSEIIENLRNDGIEVKHFVLWASKETILKRLRSRADGKNSWPAQQVDRCLQGLSNELFGTHIDTEKKPIGKVVEEMASQLNLSLQPDRRTPIEKIYDNLKVKLKHIRL